MTFKSLALAAATVALLSGAAVAQDATSETQTNSIDKSSQLDQDQREMRAPFYTDDTMATMRTGEEFNAAWAAMSADDQEKIRADCANSTSPEDEFCRGIENIQSQ